MHSNVTAVQTGVDAGHETLVRIGDEIYRLVVDLVADEERLVEVAVVAAVVDGDVTARVVSHAS